MASGPADVTADSGVQHDIATITTAASTRVTNTFGGTGGGGGSASTGSAAEGPTGQLSNRVDTSTAATTEGGVSSMTGQSNAAPRLMAGSPPLDSEMKTQVLYHMTS